MFVLDLSGITGASRSGDAEFVSLTRTPPPPRRRSESDRYESDSDPTGVRGMGLSGAGTEPSYTNGIYLLNRETESSLLRWFQERDLRVSNFFNVDRDEENQLARYTFRDNISPEELGNLNRALCTQFDINYETLQEMMQADMRRSKEDMEFEEVANTIAFSGKVLLEALIRLLSGELTTEAAISFASGLLPIAAEEAKHDALVYAKEHPGSSGADEAAEVEDIVEDAANIDVDFDCSCDEDGLSDVDNLGEGSFVSADADTDDLTMSETGNDGEVLSSEEISEETTVTMPEVDAEEEVSDYEVTTGGAKEGTSLDIDDPLAEGGEVEGVPIEEGLEDSCEVEEENAEDAINVAFDTVDDLPTVASQIVYEEQTEETQGRNALALRTRQIANNNNIQEQIATLRIQINDTPDPIERRGLQARVAQLQLGINPPIDPRTNGHHFNVVA